MLLIDHSKEEGIGGGVLSHAAHSTEAYCLTVRFTLWKGNSYYIMSSTETNACCLWNLLYNSITHLCVAVAGRK